MVSLMHAVTDLQNTGWKPFMSYCQDFRRQAAWLQWNWITISCSMMTHIIEDQPV